MIVKFSKNIYSMILIVLLAIGLLHCSDEYSFKYLQSTEYYPGAIKFFFDKIQREQGRSGGGFERLLSTHPLPQDRIDNVNVMLQHICNPSATEANLLTQRYLQFKATLP